MKQLTYTLIVLSLCAMSVEAQRRGDGKRGEGERGASRDFQAVRGEFEAWQKVNLEAGALTALGGDALQSAASEAYQAMSKAVEEERMLDEDFSTLGTDYLRLVLNRGKESEENVTKKLNELAAEAKEKSQGVMEVASATPQVNLLQVQAQEYLWFGILTEKLSRGKRATIKRKQKELLGLEEKAKKDKKVEERERSKLLEEANEIVSELTTALSK